jgi:hypothetical protein
MYKPNVRYKPNVQAGLYRLRNISKFISISISIQVVLLVHRINHPGLPRTNDQHPSQDVCSVWQEVCSTRSIDLVLVLKYLTLGTKISNLIYGKPRPVFCVAGGMLHPQYWY